MSYQEAEEGAMEYGTANNERLEGGAKGRTKGKQLVAPPAVALEYMVIMELGELEEARG